MLLPNLSLPIVALRRPMLGSDLAYSLEIGSDPPTGLEGIGLKIPEPSP